MLAYTYELEKEFESIDNLLKNKYGVNIKEKEQYVEFVRDSLGLLMSLKIWNKHLEEILDNVKGIDNYFKEMISNTIHMIILGTLDLKVPALVMLRRTQESILSFLYFYEHPVEYYKKENDDNIKILSGFSELKDYVKGYPFSIKYNLGDQDVRSIVQKIIDDWGIQYKDLSNYVHGTNSKYFQQVSYFDEFKFEKKEINYLKKQVQKLSSIINGLLICFFFERYVRFDENMEKSLVRNCINNETGYKAKIVGVFKEI